MPGICQPADQLGMPVGEGLDRVRGGRLADGVGHVDGVEIAGGEEAVHGFQADVVGVDVVGLLPAQFAHRGVGRRADAAGFGADGRVLAVRLVPDRDDLGALLGGQHAGAQLGLGLVGETVADAEGVFGQRQHGFDRHLLGG